MCTRECCNASETKRTNRDVTSGILQSTSAFNPHDCGDFIGILTLGKDGGRLKDQKRNGHIHF